MRILFITTNNADYLQDSILHGLRSLFKEELVDYPQKVMLYNNFAAGNIYGRGFTLYRLLEDIHIERYNIEQNLKNNLFDLIIFGSVHSQYGIFFQLIPYLNISKTIFLDGEDNQALFPYYGFFWRRPYYWTLPRVHKKFLYFKREWTPETHYYRAYKLLSQKIAKVIFPLKNLRRISFSIPQEKIIEALPLKKKLFPKHIVDEEIAEKVEGSFIKYAFDNEAEYYQDIQDSKFGITTKRSGWDCLRHYEIAANGTVICFKDLDKKPESCAPHGLIPGVNCISYKNYDDLKNIINNLSDEKYKELENNCWEWAKNNTTIIRAQELLSEAGINESPQNTY